MCFLIFTTPLVVHINLLHLWKPDTVYRVLSGKISGCTDYFKGLKGSEVYKRMYFSLHDLAEN